MVNKAGVPNNIADYNHIQNRNKEASQEINNDIDSLITRIKKASAKVTTKILENFSREIGKLDENEIREYLSDISDRLDNISESAPTNTSKNIEKKILTSLKILQSNLLDKLNINPIEFELSDMLHGSAKTTIEIQDK